MADPLSDGLAHPIENIDYFVEHCAHDREVLPLGVLVLAPTVTVDRDVVVESVEPDLDRRPLGPPVDVGPPSADDFATTSRGLVSVFVPVRHAPLLEGSFQVPPQLMLLTRGGR